MIGFAIVGALVTAVIIILGVSVLIDKISNKEE